MGVLLIVIHVLTAVLLITVILMQSGRGGGLTESFASAESMFGARTNEFMVRVTTILAVIFLVTNLSLAYVNSKKERSLMQDVGRMKTMNIPMEKSEPQAAVPQKPEPATAQ
ncbi:MAG: preprotein translocase subunit SecG [Candidatus Omnitrophica bacterium]|nr:preprotein translocase subunit SecG [Candidatus Omnitrophota bacterium]HQP12009.1 preprotein translocase subunit SecG [Candidatus Omnitrophota bacterium]